MNKHNSSLAQKQIELRKDGVKALSPAEALVTYHIDGRIKNEYGIAMTTV